MRNAAGAGLPVQPEQSAGTVSPYQQGHDTSDSFCCLVVASPVRLLSVGFEPKQVKRVHHSF